MQIIKTASIAIMLLSVLTAEYNEYFGSLLSKLEKENHAVTMQKYKTLSAGSKRSGDFLLPDLLTETMIMASYINYCAITSHIEIVPEFYMVLMNFCSGIFLHN